MPDKSSRKSDERLTFPRERRLKRRRLIRPLFDRTRTDVHTLATGTVRILFRIATVDEVGADTDVQIGFSAGRGARGVERNRIRRLLRENYRLNQSILRNLPIPDDKVLTIMVLYRATIDQAAQNIPRDLPRVMNALRERFPGGETSSPEETGT